MDKNLIIALLLSTGFLALWYKYLAPPQRPQVQAVQKAAPAGGGSANAPGAIPASSIAPQSQAPVQERTLESDVVSLVIDSRGAGIKHWWIKEGKITHFIQDKSKAEKKDLDLINHVMVDGTRPEQLGFASYPEISFAPVPSEAGVSAWTASLPSGIEVEKRYFFKSTNGGGTSLPFVGMTVAFRNATRRPVDNIDFRLNWTGGLGTIESEEKENTRVTRVLAYPSPSKEVQKFKTGDYSYEYLWTGIDNRYYFMAVLPQAGSVKRIQVEKSKTEPGNLVLAAEPFTLAPGQSKVFEYELYGGPKGYYFLKKIGHGLEHAVDFGYFGFLGKWALKALNSLHRMTGNYGWAIILLTVCLQALVFPLTIKSFQSTAAMKKLQPKIQEIQKRYKDDPKRLNQEMMSLYKDSKTNPFGGCLPMVLQIPVFWAFFTMLRNSYELRGAPWVLWIHDLSLKDPYYVLPIIMGGGMVLQQKIAGTVGDPTQAKMMMFMPVIFTFMFLNFPSGLVLYWLTNSMLTISLQYWLMKRSEARTA